MRARPSPVLAVIPARGGSRRLPGKHLRRLAGVPLIAHTIKAALAAHSVDQVLVSTDDPRIRSVAVSFGAETPFLRPSELSGDAVASAPVVWHAVTWWERAAGRDLATVVLLQPTSPLRPAADIDAAVERLARLDLDSVVSVVDTGVPVSVLGVAEDGLWRSLASAPDARAEAVPTALRLTGGIYASRRDVLRPDRLLGDRVGALVVDADTAVDIDTLDDLRVARRVWRRARR